MLYLIRNETEYHAAVAQKPDGLILSLSKSPPYLNDHLAYLPGVGRWHDYAIDNPETSRFYLLNYDELDKCVTSIFLSNRKWNNDLFLSDNFKQGVISLFGEYYAESAYILNQFFSIITPKAISLSLDNDYIGILFQAYASKLKIAYKPLAL